VDVWTWASGRRRRRAERVVAAKLVSNALAEIRYHAGQCPEHLAVIHELADIVHNLPGGILGGGERRKQPYGCHTFRWMWETASPRQRAWLVTQLDGLRYDYGYLDKPPSPAPGKPVRWSRSAKRVDAATLLRLDPQAVFVIRHADLGAKHLIMPRGPNQPRFQPAEPGVSEYDCLLRMNDGENIVVHLRFQVALFDALAARRQVLRWTAPDRDGHLWRRSHVPDRCPDASTRHLMMKLSIRTRCDGLDSAARNAA
jgi:hypothetical protein